MNPTLRKCLEALSLRQYHNQVPIKLDKVDEVVSTRGTFQPPFKQEQERISQNCRIPAPVDNTPVVPYVPAPCGHFRDWAMEDSPKDDKTPSVPYVPVSMKCKAYYELSEGMRRLICSKCDGEGHLITEFGKARCARYKG